MNHCQILPALLVSLAFALVIGCQAGTTPPAPAGPPKASSLTHEEKIEAALNQLSVDARKLVRAQKLCPITDEELGSMGVPVLVQLEGESVFVCCKGCVKDAEADPKQTLKTVANFKAKHAPK